MSDYRYLLDTNILSDLIKNPAGDVQRHIAGSGESSICTSIIVAAELRFGARKRNAPALIERVELILSLLAVEPLAVPVDYHYADIRNQLERAGTPLGANDLIIAAHARSLDLTLVTANESEFRRVNQLRVENWLR